MPTPILFLRTAWMNRYQGLGRDEIFRTGARWPREHKYGVEILNFQPFRGHYFGYARPPLAVKKSTKSGPTIRIERLGAARDAESVDDVLVIWTAPHPRRGVVIVGWYKDAKVFRREQAPPTGAGRVYAGNPLGYYTTARLKDGVLLEPDKRTFQVPYMGQSLIWYAQDPRFGRFLNKVRAYVRAGGTRRSHVAAGTTRSTHRDLFQRLEIERAAITKVTEYYEGAGYSIRSVERDRIGWDLEVSCLADFLRVEVKGRAGSAVLGDLSPNEFEQFQKYRSTYRICIVTNALTQPKLHIFAYSRTARRWTDPDGRELLVMKRVGAIVTATEQ